MLPFSIPLIGSLHRLERALRRLHEKQLGLVIYGAGAAAKGLLSWTRPLQSLMLPFSIPLIGSCHALKNLYTAINSRIKNVPKTIEICRESEADEIWLLTSSAVDTYEGVDRVFSRLPIEDTAKVYRSCDVLVKLSLVEGMFGPPLEMFQELILRPEKTLVSGNF